MGPSSGGLCFSLFVPARFGTLDERAKFHQVMRCCPSCGSPLVLFREKFGEVPGRSPPGRVPPGKGPPGAPGGGDQNPFTNGGLTGGWVCTKCGVHIIPNSKSQTSATSPDPKHHGSGGRSGSGNSPDRNRPRSGSRPGSREVSPHTRQGGSPHQGAPQSPHGNKGDNPPNMVNGSSTSPMSPKAPVIIDDDYEIWERQVKHSFTAFLTQIRERLGSKEMSLKQYQVTLCQRERQLRSNEENMQHRWNKVKQSEQNFRTKMDRLNLYKETMIHQLEAKAKQLTQYEQRLRNMDFRASSHDVRGSMHDVKGSTLDFRLSDPPADVQNISISSNPRNASIDGGKDPGKDVWNSSVNSDVQNNAFVSQNGSPRMAKGSSAGDGHAGSFGDHRPKVGVTMVKPTVELRKPVMSASGETRGSQNALARDFRPSGATSANINQIYTRDTSTMYSWAKPPGQAQHKMPAANKSVHYPDSSNYMYRKPQQQAQKPLSPPASRNGSTYDVRQAYFARQPHESAPVRKTSGSDVRHQAPDVRHSGSSDVRHSGSSDVRKSPSDVRLSGEANVRHSTVTDARPANGDVRHSRSDVRRGADVIRHRSPTHTALPPQQKPPMPLKSALKSPDSGASQRWSTQTNLHVTTAEPQVVTSFIEHDSISLSPSERERSVSGVSDLSPTYTTSGYASDRENSMNGGGVSGPGKKAEKHNVSFDDVISSSSPQSSVERDTRPPWMKRRSRRLTEV